MLETYLRERLGVAKSHNAPKFSMYFYEHAECLIAVCFRIFPKVISRSCTLLVFYHLKERQRSPGFESPVFRCLFPEISQKTYPFPPNRSSLLRDNAKHARPFDACSMQFKRTPPKKSSKVVCIIFGLVSQPDRGGSLLLLPETRVLIKPI